MTRLPPVRDDFEGEDREPEASDAPDRGFSETLFPEVEQARALEDEQSAEDAALEGEALDGEGEPVRRYRAIRENIECLAIAVLLALVIRHYVFEPFQIPTGSMATTLLGKHRLYECEHCDWSWSVNDDVYDVPEICPHCRLGIDPGEQPLWNGEKIVANKMVYFFREPVRWESCVFRPPHKNHVNFIKRIISTGGEKVVIDNGDVFIDDVISPKPRKVQEQVWIPVYDSRHDVAGAKFFDFRRKSRDGDRKDAGGWERKHSGGGATYAFTDLKDSFTYSMIWSRSEGDSEGSGILGSRQEIPSALSYNDYESSRIVGDLRIDAEIKLEDAAGGRITFEISDGPQKFTLELGDVNRVVHRRGNVVVKTWELDVTLGAGARHDVSFANWDNHLLVRVDGRDILDVQAESDPGDVNGDVGTLALMARDSDLEIRNLRVWRDIHYKAYEDRTMTKRRREWDVPGDKLLVLGDNTDSSNDSRSWGFVPRENLKGRPWLRVLHVEMGRLTEIDWDLVAIGNVE